MNPLKRKTLWVEKWQPDLEGNTLSIRYEKIQTVSSRPTPIDWACIVEITSPAESDDGRSIKKKARIVVDVEDFRMGLQTIERDDSKGPSPQHCTTQLCYEGKNELMIVWEIPPFGSQAEPRGRYVIGNRSGDVRFIVGTHSEILGLVGELESLRRL